jgi:hypothetical protein
MEKTKTMRIAGWVLTGLSGMFLLMDAGMKLARLPVVLEATTQLGWPAESALPLGIVLLLATLLYLVPRTSVLGAMLLTGYLGGAVATHARIASPLWSHTLFGLYVGVLVWAGIWLREPRLRAVVPAFSGHP